MAHLALLQLATLIEKDRRVSALVSRRMPRWEEHPGWWLRVGHRDKLTEPWEILADVRLGSSRLKSRPARDRAIKVLGFDPGWRRMGGEWYVPDLGAVDGG